MSARVGVMSSLVLAFVFHGSWVRSQVERPGELLERAYFLEQGTGDLEGAIDIYERFIEEFPDERALAARALFRIGLCHERLGYDRATDAYTRLVRDYADQQGLVRLARERLADLRRSRERARVDLPAGATLREIVLSDRNSVNDSSASISPDATQLAYEDPKMRRLVVYDLVRRRGHWTVPLSGQSTGNAYRWSRNGRRLAFAETRGEGWAVRALDVESGRAHDLLRADFAEVVDWSPDGESLLVHAYSRPDDTWRLVAVGLGGEIHWEMPVEGRHLRLSPSGAFIAFTGEEKDEEIFVAPVPLEDGEVVDGSTGVTPEGAVRVAPHPARDVQPVWSPDGRQLAFLSNRAKSWDLWVVELEEGRPLGEPRMLQTDFGERAELRDWLSGGKLSFTKPHSLLDIWIQPVEPATGRASAPAFLAPTELRGRNAQPRWSPDSKRLSFRGRFDADRSALFVTSLDGEPARAIPIPWEFQNADWSVDGQRLLFCAFGDRELFLAEYDLGTGESRVVSPELRIPNLFAPHLSPDGRRLLYQAASATTGVDGQFVFEMSTGASRMIPYTEGTQRADWSPDGRWIAVSDSQSICLLRPDGSDKRCLVEVQDPYRINAWFSWSPDGRLIAYPKGSYSGNDFDWELWLVSVDGVTHERVGEAPELSPWWVDWSPDGAKLALSTTSGSSGLWVLENFFDGTHSHPGEDDE